MPKDKLIDYDAHRRRPPTLTTDKLGPLIVLIQRVEWGTTYTLFADGKRIESWASHPGWSYASDALIRAALRGVIDQRRCTELLIEADEAHRANSRKPSG